MANQVPSVRGMNDLLPADNLHWHRLEAACRAMFASHGYREIRTPIVEMTDLFARGIGEATDILEKQMYTFKDRGDRSLTLRPEMTAGCARAYVEHSMGHAEPVTRLWYEGQMFRYERMQTGRYRQFWQIGCEVYGIADAGIEAEQIGMLFRLFNSLGVKGLHVLINSVGTNADRLVYREQLLAYLRPQADKLCADCQRRLEVNPLRVLDCKIDGGSPILAGAPKLSEALSPESKARFEQTLEYLKLLEIPFEVDGTLVRGLDYYTGCVFEIKCENPALGTQSTLAGGGRYDNLIESLGGNPTPAMGFAFGVERAILCMEAPEQKPAVDVFIACMGGKARGAGLVLADKLRAGGIATEVELRDASVKSQFKRADKMGVRVAITIGDSEIESGKATAKHMTDKRTAEVVFADPVASVQSLL